MPNAIKALSNVLVTELVAEYEKRTALRKSFDQSRMDALTLLIKGNNLLANDTISDVSFVHSVKSIRASVLKNGKFGLFGHSGSFLIKHLDEYLHQASEIIARDNFAANKPACPAKALAIITIHDICNRQDSKTASNRRTAVALMKAAVENPGLQGEDFVKRIEEIRNTVETSKQFGIRGKKGSSFLKIVNRFLEQARQLVSTMSVSTRKENTVQQPILATRPLTPPPAETMEEQPQRQENGLQTPSLDILDKKREALEDEISQF